MKIIPCEHDKALKRQVESLAEELKNKAHTLSQSGYSEDEFYRSGLFRGAIERIRGQYSATMREKRAFVHAILSHMQDRGLVVEWTAAGGKNRHDYTVKLQTGRLAVIEAKGCLDGNNTTIFERPNNADEFVIWSLCMNPSGNPGKNVWSGIHTRLSAEVISKQKQVDGLVVWDWLCGTAGRPCPKLLALPVRQTPIGANQLPPPCIYLFPRTIPEPRNNPNPEAHGLGDVHFLQALHTCFLGRDEEVSSVRFAVEYKGTDILRTTTIERNGVVQHVSKPKAIRR